MATELCSRLSTLHSLLSTIYSPLSTLYSLLSDCVLSAARLHLTACQLPHKDGCSHRSGSYLVLVLVELWRRRGLISCWDPCCLRSSLPRPRPRPHHLVEAYCRAHVTWHLVQLQLDASCGKLAACGSCSATPIDGLGAEIPHLILLVPCDAAQFPLGPACWTTIYWARPLRPAVNHVLNMPRNADIDVEVARG